MSLGLDVSLSTRAATMQIIQPPKMPNNKPLAVVKAIDHLVLTCASVPATISFYTRYLGMKAETFQAGTTRHSLRFGSQKINLHQKGREFEPKAKTALPGTADLCFLLDDDHQQQDEGRIDLDGLVQAFRKEGIDVLKGGQVVARTGARGPMRSVYIRDPDGNLVE